MTFVVSEAVAVLVAPPPVTVATLVTLGTAATPTPTIKVMGLPFAPTAAIGVTDVQVTFCPTAAHVQPTPVPDTNVKPAGSGSVTVTVPAVAAVPLLAGVMVYVPLRPTMKSPTCDFASARFASPRIVVGSLAVAVLGARPPLALALLMTVPMADAATATLSVIGLPVAPAAIGVLDVHVAACPAPVHVQPVPVADTYVKPAGIVSVTVMAPSVATGPVFETVSVYAAGWPTIKSPV